MELLHAAGDVRHDVTASQISKDLYKNIHTFTALIEAMDSFTDT
jgi:hypothetical protein